MEQRHGTAHLSIVLISRTLQTAASIAIHTGMPYGTGEITSRGWTAEAREEATKAFGVGANAMAYRLIKLNENETLVAS